MSLGHGASIVRSGLVLHLDAANKKSYPGTGTTWSDLSNNNRNGILSNGPTFNNGSFTLDGSNDFISVSNTSSVDFTNNFSIECVFKQISGANPGPIVEKYNWSTAGLGGWGLRFNGGSLAFFGNNVTSGSQVNIASSLSTNITYHIIVVCDGGPVNPTIRFYLNGALNNTGSLTTSITSTIGKEIMIGQRGDASGAHNNVNVSLVKMYNKVISASEAKQNFEAIRGRYGI